MPDDLDTAMDTNAAGPARVSGDGWSADQHSLPDQIELARFKAAKAAAANPALGFARMKIVSPGAL